MSTSVDALLDSEPIPDLHGTPTESLFLPNSLLDKHGDAGDPTERSSGGDEFSRTNPCTNALDESPTSCTGLGLSASPPEGWFFAPPADDLLYSGPEVYQQQAAVVQQAPCHQALQVSTAVLQHQHPQGQTPQERLQVVTDPAVGVLLHADATLSINPAHRTPGPCASGCSDDNLLSYLLFPDSDECPPLGDVSNQATINVFSPHSQLQQGENEQPGQLPWSLHYLQQQVLAQHQQQPGYGQQQLSELQGYTGQQQEPHPAVPQERLLQQQQPLQPHHQQQQPLLPQGHVPAAELLLSGTLPFEHTLPDDVLLSFWREVDFDRADGKAFWSELVANGGPMDLEYRQRLDGRWRMRPRVALPTCLIEQVWPDVSSCNGQMTGEKQQCQALEFAGPAELRIFGPVNMQSTGGSKTRFARLLRSTQHLLQQQQQQQQHDQHHSLGRHGGSGSRGITESRRCFDVVDKYSYRAEVQGRIHIVEKVMLAEFVAQDTEEGFKAWNNANMRKKKKKSSLSTPDDWEEGVSEEEYNRGSYVRLRWRHFWPSLYTVKPPSSSGQKMTAVSGCDGEKAVLQDSKRVAVKSQHQAFSQQEQAPAVGSPPGRVVAQAKVAAVQEEGAAHASSGTGQPDASKHRKHVQLLAELLPDFLKAELHNIRGLEMLKLCIQSLGGVTDMLALRDHNDKGYGLLNIMLHTAINLIQQAADDGVAACEGSSSLDALSKKIQDSVVAVFDLVWERLGEEHAAMPADQQARRMLLVQQDRDWHDTPSHMCARHDLLIVQRWLLERCDAAMMLVATKDGWLPLAAACRAGNSRAAAAYLRRARELGMFELEQGGRSPSRYQEVVLADLTPLNKYYRDSNARSFLERAVAEVWPDGDGPVVFGGMQDAETLKQQIEQLQSELLTYKLTP